MNLDDYLTGRFVRPESGRKYVNHLATHTRGGWGWHRLLSSGLYIKTSEPNAPCWEVVGEMGPELVNFELDTRILRSK